MDDAQRRLAELMDPSMRGVMAVIDILLVAFLIYRLLKLVRGTRAWKVLIGIGVFVLALFLSDLFQLRTLHWILEKASVLAPVALVILLLPELRQAIEGFAKIGLLPERLLTGENSTSHTILDEIVEAAENMAKRNIGALIVIEREEKLTEVARNGVPLNAEVTAALLEAVFYHGNPLHDGAAIIRKDHLLAAACRLPLSENPLLDAQYHMRHRAGVGVSESADCVVVIVSEERGEVSLAVDGELIHCKSSEELKEKLKSLVSSASEERGPRRMFGRRQNREMEHTP